MICPECQVEFLPSKKNPNQKLCSKQCANDWQSRSKSRTGKLRSTGGTCPQCSSHFMSTTHNRKKFCSQSCSATYSNMRRQRIRVSANYRRACTFSFNPELYPSKFDLDLIKQFGWYNRETNPNGLVKDHMVSVKYGSEHSIPVNVINHPANCQLISHKENGKKSSQCSISIENLYERIKNW